MVTKFLTLFSPWQLTRSVKSGKTLAKILNVFIVNSKEKRR